MSASISPRADQIVANPGREPHFFVRGRSVFDGPRQCDNVGKQAAFGIASHQTLDGGDGGEAGSGAHRLDAVQRGGRVDDRQPGAQAGKGRCIENPGQGEGRGVASAWRHRLCRVLPPVEGSWTRLRR